MLQLWIIAILCLYTSVVSSKYSCVMENMKVNCNSMEQHDLSEDLEVAISSGDVLDLTVSDSRIPLINKTMLRRYQRLHTLKLQHVQAESIEDGAFSELFSLRNLYLSDNLLRNFSTRIIANNSALYQLDVSNNLLQDLSDFNISSFPVLTILNISNNRLRYLPESLVDKLEEENSFYLIVDNNPWDCTHLKWIHIMSLTLANTFCIENRYNESLAQNEMFLKATNSSDAANKTIGASAKSCKYDSWCFSYCIFWFVGAIWIGIILGNVCKLKKLICVSNSRYHDKNTQYDKMDFRLRN